MDDQPTTTHVLRVEVPLDLTDAPAGFDYHPVEEALRAVLAISRLAAASVIAGDAQVTLLDLPFATQQPTDPCRATRWKGTPEFGGPHRSHLFTYGPQGMYTGNCAGWGLVSTPPAVAQDFANSGIAVAERPQGVEAWPDDVEMGEMCCCGHTLGQHAYGADRAVCDQPDGRCDCLDFHQDYQHPPAQPDRASDSYHSYHSGNRP